MRIFILLLWFILALPLAALAQNDQRDALTAFLEDNLSSDDRKVTVTGFRGAFSSRAEIDKLTIADSEGVWITVSGIVLDWSRAALFGGVIDISELTATEVNIARAPVSTAKPTAPEATGFALPDLPVSVSIKKLEAARIVLGESLLGQKVEGSISAAITLEGGSGRISLQATRSGGGPAGHVTLVAGYSNATRQTEIDLDAGEAAGGVAVTLLKVPGAPDSVLKIKGAGPVDDFTTRVLLATGGETRLEGDITLQTGKDDALTFSTDLAGDLAPLFLPEYAEFFGPDVRFRAKGLRQQQGQFELSALTLDTRALVLDGSVAIAADGIPQRVSLTGRLGLPDGTPVLLPLSGGVETRVANADLRLNFDASQGDGWRGALTLTGLDRPEMQLSRAVLSGSGKISRSGSQAGGGAIVDATLEFEAKGLTPRDVSLAAALGADLARGADLTGSGVLTWQQAGGGVQISGLKLNGAGYGLALTGSIGDLAQGFPVEGKVEARYDSLAQLSGLAGRALSGGAQIAATGGGTLLGGAFDAEAEISGQSIAIGQPELDALLQGPSSISLSARRDAGGTVLRRLTLTARQLRATVSGKLASDGSDLKADLRFADLAVLGPGYQGALQAEAAFSGTPLAGRLRLDGIAQDLKFGQAEADAALKGESRLALDVALKDKRFEIDTLTISNPQLTAGATGYYADSGSELSAEVALADLAPLRPGLRGALQAKLRASGTIAAGRLELTGQGRNLATGQAEADTLLAGSNRVSAIATIRDKRLAIESAEITNPQLDLSLSGSVTDALRQITLTGRLANLALLVPEFPGALQLSGSVKEDVSGFVLDLTGQGPGGVDARVAGRVSSNMRSADLTIKGVAQAALANAFLRGRSVSGQAAFDLRLNGPLALRSLSGQANLRNGRLSDPALPLGLRNISASAGLGGSAVQLDLTADATTGGRITVKGGIGLAAPNDADLTIGLTALTLRNPDLFKTILGGTLQIAGPLTGGALISGDILVGDTELQVPSTGLGGSGAIADLRHVGESAAVHRTRDYAGLIADTGAASGTSSRPLRLEIRINAPQRIFLRGRGLDAELGGRLTLRGNTDNIIPGGAIELVRGRLDILGKRLDLDQAKLELQGKFIPYLTVLASNAGNGVTSYVEISGPADEPVVRFYSSPDLPQEEVLAQLLFGRDLTTISALQALQLASAVATLAGKGGDGIVGNLRNSFGLDDLDVSTDASGNSAVKAGKYISSKIYSEVEVDQNGQSKINLNLDITKSTKLRGSVASDGQTGIGIFVERDY